MPRATVVGLPPLFLLIDVALALELAGVLLLAVVTGIYAASWREHSARLNYSLLCTLDQEAESYERLLENLLPRQLFARLIAGEPITAMEHPQVTILQLDLVNFTASASSMSPQRVFHFLDQFFRKLDGLLMLFPNLYKVESVGDSLVLVGGLFDQEQLSVAGRLEASFSMLELACLIQTVAKTLPPIGDRPVVLRIGIASGAVVSGTVGVKIPKFHVWGQPVLRAAHLETRCPVGQILVDKQVENMARGRFVFEEANGGFVCTGRVKR